MYRRHSECHGGNHFHDDVGELCCVVWLDGVGEIGSLWCSELVVNVVVGIGMSLAFS